MEVLRDMGTSIGITGELLWQMKMWWAIPAALVLLLVGLLWLRSASG